MLPESILDRHKLRKTSIRLALLRYLSNKHRAVSQSELEDYFKAENRVTIYRVLKDFERKGMIHRVLHTEQGNLFALCRDCHHLTAHPEEHAHFKCTDCSKVYCMPKVKLPSLSLPNGFVPKVFVYHILGTCNHCSQAS
ncbi:MAG TPA: transcriptional repressor [Saprospiraceae bacterium]|nr:transcriptional repressor [Saprospiraceae bacterium]HQW54540.1 transcriptional repressor [Saprospiraceae bacterium]